MIAIIEPGLDEKESVREMRKKRNEMKGKMDLFYIPLFFFFLHNRSISISFQFQGVRRKVVSIDLLLDRRIYSHYDKYHWNPREICYKIIRSSILLSITNFP